MRAFVRRWTCGYKRDYKGPKKAIAIAIDADGAGGSNASNAT